MGHFEQSFIAEFGRNFGRIHTFSC